MNNAPESLEGSWMLEGEQLMSAVPHHLGVIPDGNRRYARRTGMSLEEGYLAGAAKALEGVDWCLEAGVRHLSAFGISRENIERRPMSEVDWAHRAVLCFCRAVRDRPDVRLHVFGDPSTLPPSLAERDEFMRLQENDDTADARLVVHAGVNYSAQAELTRLTQLARRRGLSTVEASPEEFTLSAGVPPVDLVVRTGGQQRLSGFLPLQTAYAELWFTPTLWPEIQREEFLAALAWFARQERHFGE
jgi:undecaprenyl diphosphate synthase